MRPSAPDPRRRSLRPSLALAGLCIMCLLVPATETLAASTATIASHLSGRGSGGSSFTLDVTFADQGGGVPTPVRRATLGIPAGFALQIPRLSSCDRRTLTTRGPNGCASPSKLGDGEAVVEALMGSQVLTERVSLSIFLGPLQNLKPTVEVLARGYTPFDRRFVFAGSLLAGESRLGERLVLSIPSIPTLPLEPDASVSSLHLRIGGSGREGNRNSIRVPRRCPPGGFAVTGEFAYADGSSSSSRTTIPCPR